MCYNITNYAILCKDTKEELIMAENKEYISNVQENGTVNISEEVIATIVTTAVKDVDGVVSLNGSFSEDLAGMLGRKNANKGVRIVLGEQDVQVECNLIVLYGHSVVEIAKNVQNSITTAVESMTGLTVSNVDVNVCGISMTK